MCAAAATSVLACAAGEKTPDETQTSSQASICVDRDAGDDWWFWSYQSRTGNFHAIVQATPGANNIDAVIGLSKGAATTWSQLAVIVRFAPSGFIDVRRGNTYAADTSISYVAGTTYSFRIDVDVPAHTYSVGVRIGESGAYTRIATDYAFRTEQANVTSLDSAAAYVDTTAPGSLQICDFDTVEDDSTPDGCVTSTAGASFANAWIPPMQNAVVAQFTATPSENNIDGVVGYSVGEADAFGDYVASVRFSTAGAIEARDGDTYKATNPMSYTAGHTYRFYVVLDMASATYSVYASDGFTTSSYTVIADGFAFRPTQAGVTLINNVATIVDSSAGQVRACYFRTTSPAELRNARSGGGYGLAAFRDGRVALSRNGIVEIVDNTMHTLASAPLAADHMTTDANGNLYLASYDYTTTTLTLRSVTSTLQPRWTRTFQTPALGTFGVYDNGDIAIGLAPWDAPHAQLLTLRSDGTEASRIDLIPDDAQGLGWGAAIGRDRYAISYQTADGIAVEVHSPDGALLWKRTWSGDASVPSVVVEPSGSVVFGGSFGGDGIDFGAGHWEPYYSSEVRLNGYIVALSETGSLRFAYRTFVDEPMSLSSSGDRIVYATTQWSQIPHPQLFVYGRNGEQIRTGTLTLIDDSAGSIEGAIATSEGLTVANVSLRLHPSNAVPRWPFLMSFVY